QETQALMALTDDLQKPFENAVSIMAGISGRIVCTGIGKSGHVAAKIAATLTSTGSPAFFLHPTEAAHGDLGSILANDAILAFSRSGRAVEMITILEFAQSKDVPIVLISENDRDSLAEYAQVVLKMPSIKEAWGHAPTTSTIIQMATGDAIAVTLAQRKGFTDQSFHELHPGGALGEKKKKF
ncbi:MAG: SIS domain-containing protein, partial [Rhodospirillales bacterium]